MIDIVEFSRHFLTTSLPILVGIIWLFHLRKHPTKINLILSIIYYTILLYYIYRLFW